MFLVGLNIPLIQPEAELAQVRGNAACGTGAQVVLKGGAVPGGIGSGNAACGTGAQVVLIIERSGARGISSGSAAGSGAQVVL